MPLILRLFVRALVVWLLFILAEVAQGALRRGLFGGDTPLLVRQVSTGLGVLIFFALTWFSASWLRLRSAPQALATGLVWAGLTFAFEAVLGQWLGVDWAQMVADYDVRQGGLMGFGLAALAVTPWIVWKLRAGGRAVDPPQGRPGRRAF